MQRAIAVLAITLCLTARPISADQPTPLAGRIDTTFTLVPTAVPGVFLAAIVGSGQVSHLGHSTLRSNTVVDSRSVPNPLTGGIVLTAANGDELHGVLVGQGTAVDAAGHTAFTGIFAFSGGTGRFSTATGHAGFSGGADVVSQAGGFSFAGTVSSPGR